MTHPGITRSISHSDGYSTLDPPAAPAAVTLRGVRKAYGAQPVLGGLDLDVPAGTITAVLGASGCGKTNLLRLLAGFETTDAGTIALHGRTVDDGRRPLAPEHRSDVATVLRRSGTTAVLVTHDQDEALSMAELVAVLRDGRIVQAADPTTVYEQPVDAEVARFVGEANPLAGHVLGSTARSPLGKHPLRPDPVRPDTPRLPAAALIMVRPEQLQLRPASSRDPAAAVTRQGPATGLPRPRHHHHPRRAGQRTHYR